MSHYDNVVNYTYPTDGGVKLLENGIKLMNQPYFCSGSQKHDFNECAVLTAVRPLTLFRIIAVRRFPQESPTPQLFDASALDAGLMFMRQAYHESPQKFLVSHAIA